MAKMKLWLAKEYLHWRQAVGLFSAITETDASPVDLVDLARKYKTPVYMTSCPSGLPAEETYHQGCSTFLVYGSYQDGRAAVYCDFGNGGADYIDGNGNIHSGIAHFKPTDIEDLAAKINGKSHAHEELEQLRQRVTELESESPTNSALLVIARSLELYLGDGANRNQVRFVADLRQGHGTVRGLSDRTIDGLLAKAKEALANARKS